MEFEVRPGHHREVHREVPSTMTNQPTERLRSGRAPGRRGSGYGHGVRFGLIALGLIAGASPSWTAEAAEVVEVRVGRHPDFTRVVFELDSSAGYRIERSDPSAKESELIISLEAGSIPRRIQSSKSFIEQVVVEPSGTRSIARIRLARGGLRLKEMILASPPRIVLDVIAENDGTTTAARPSSTPAVTKTAATTPARTPQAPVKPAVTTPATPPAAKPTATIAKAAPTTKPTPTPAASPPTPPTPPRTRVLATTEDPDAKTPSPAPSPSASSTPSDADAMADATRGNESGANAASEWNDGGAQDPTAAALADGSADGPGSQDAAPADAEQPKARPMMVKSSDSGADSEAGEGGGLMTWSLAGLGLAVAAFGGLVVARRRRASAEHDFVDDEVSDASDEGEEDEEEEESSTSASSNPFAELTGGSASLASGMTRSGVSASRPAEKVSDKPEKKPSESLLFDDAEEKTMESMDVVSRSQGNEGLAGVMPMMGAGSDELTQMFREMQRRVAALEGRIDELVDARDRLERQVAAQTEELRVQRAAIARTQRAVRNLARPEEGTDDEPTEPALREPS